jgi:hypothetical protein
LPRTPARHLLIVRGVHTENSQTLILKIMQEFSLRSNGKGRQRRVLASARTVTGLSFEERSDENYRLSFFIVRENPI